MGYRYSLDLSPEFLFASGDLALRIVRAKTRAKSIGSILQLLSLFCGRLYCLSQVRIQFIRFPGIRMVARGCLGKTIKFFSDYSCMWSFFLGRVLPTIEVTLHAIGLRDDKNGEPHGHHQH